MISCCTTSIICGYVYQHLHRLGIAMFCNIISLSYFTLSLVGQSDIVMSVSVCLHPKPQNFLAVLSIASTCSSFGGTAMSCTVGLITHLHIMADIVTCKGVRDSLVAALDWQQNLNCLIVSCYHLYAKKCTFGTLMISNHVVTFSKSSPQAITKI